ncbi:outer membrane protein assembly factor BamB [Methylomarinovum caldicuralii]|uniref:Outer membrane protein assembly factor BamB n=1 Tax=Methylomarinovum caldicuralii TaxID=438856 RepID=A0AAU9CVD3_9GAMM|nr:outer membrane protein assembly factor BamB [Methylomarinovum caldicuralii]BCX81877.1 outer membrane protein assembly factor BamB [Methylomarinovum caldicuralii]
MMRLFFLPLLLLLTGCQSTGAGFSNLVSGTIDLVTGADSAEEPPRELVAVTPELRIETVWDEDVGAGDGGYRLALAPAVADETVYAADHEGRVAGLRLADGEEILALEGDRPLSAGPAVSATILLLGTSEAEVLALERETGRQRWIAQVSSEVLARPAVAEGIVVVHTNDGAVFALAEDSGRRLWSYGKAVSRLSLRGVAPPVIADDTVLIGFANGRMAALRLGDGKLIWERQLAIPTGLSEMERVVDINAAPAVRSGMLYATAFHGGVIAASLVDGEVIWRNTDIVADSTPAVSWRYVFVTDTEGNVWGLDETTGRAYWKQDAFYHREVTAPVVYGDFIAVGDYKGYVHFLAQEDGRQLGRVRVARSPIRAPLVVAGDYLIVYAGNGDLTVLKAEPKDE